MCCIDQTDAYLVGASLCGNSWTYKPTEVWMKGINYEMPQTFHSLPFKRHAEYTGLPVTWRCGTTEAWCGVKLLQTNIILSAQSNKRLGPFCLFPSGPPYIPTRLLWLRESSQQLSVCNEWKAPWGVLWSMTKRPGSFWMYACVTAF